MNCFLVIFSIMKLYRYENCTGMKSEAEKRTAYNNNDNIYILYIYRVYLKLSLVRYMFETLNKFRKCI